MWHFWIDRGGTFTDIIARPPKDFLASQSQAKFGTRFGELLYMKILSESPSYKDATLEGIARMMGIACHGKIPEKIPIEKIHSIKMGTTIATNALLERKGEPTIFLTAKGFKDLLVIGYQERSDIFALNIKRAQPLYSRVLEINARIDAKGRSVVALDEGEVESLLQNAFKQGLRSLAIALPHAYRFPRSEQRVASIARKIGFQQISASHEVSPLIKMVARADTTVLDAYLSPVVKRYRQGFASALGTNARKAENQQAKLFFMQSNGGLVESSYFRGKDAVLSGPAGGVVGMVKTASQAQAQNKKVKLIGFDMGGTSTDVSHYDGEYERRFETSIDGVRLRTPMMNIRTIAAGGGSIVGYDGLRLQVGPRSAGANPGPACYGRGGPLTLTDCNLLLGRIQAQHFPKQFGTTNDQPITRKLVLEKFNALRSSMEHSKRGGRSLTNEAIALGFIDIAVDSMANAIKEISVQRGYDITKYTLQCFGGASGQHACAVAERLGIKRIFMHPLAGLLSAYGIGQAEIRCLREAQVEKVFASDANSVVMDACARLEKEASAQVLSQIGGRAAEHSAKNSKHIGVSRKVRLRAQGSDTYLEVSVASADKMRLAYLAKHKLTFGFHAARNLNLIIESVSLEVFAQTETASEMTPASSARASVASEHSLVDIYTSRGWLSCPLYRGEDFNARFLNNSHAGPMVITDHGSTLFIEQQWQATSDARGNIIATRDDDKRTYARTSLKNVQSDEKTADPIMLEIFGNLFKSIAEQMGLSLQSTAHSVNIKERLDFSCAIFDLYGNLVANAPHIPVHLGSMSASIKAVITKHKETMRVGDSFVLNSPYNGGTHLPDITVVKPFYENDNAEQPLFYLASRGHHADIGGSTPGSAPANSTRIDEEGVLLDNILLVAKQRFLEKEVRAILLGATYPCRNVETNLADLRAQVSANETGARALANAIENFSLARIVEYAAHLQDQGEECVRRIIDRLARGGSFLYRLDDGSKIAVCITLDHKKREALIDFSGTSPQHAGNYNAPAAICRAAVLYVFRTLISYNETAGKNNGATDIPLNDGCMRALRIVILPRSILSPEYPAAVVAGNTEVSQGIVDCLYGALGILAASQGTMNNVIYGNERYQNYETICGGTGASAEHAGTSAIHSHMTNTRMTDLEVLEQRFPVRLDSFAIIAGSGGAGAKRGGDGVSRRLTFLERSKLTILSSRRIEYPYGLCGGEAGRRGRNYILRASASGGVKKLAKKGSRKQETLKGNDEATMECGDTFVMETPGGGGYGFVNR